MISVVMPSITDTRFERGRAHFAQVLSGTPHEIIHVKKSQGMAEGYNRGFTQAKGDLIIFCHDDVEFLVPSITQRLTRALTQCDIVGLAGTNRLVSPVWNAAGPAHCFGLIGHPFENKGKYAISIFAAPCRTVLNIQGLDGMFMACRRDVAERLQWDAETFTQFHLYDLDWSFRASLAGFKVGVIVDLPVIHLSLGNYQDKTWKTSAEAFLKKHQSNLGQAFSRPFAFGSIYLSSKREVSETFAELHRHLPEEE